MKRRPGVTGRRNLSLYGRERHSGAGGGVDPAGQRIPVSTGTAGRKSVRSQIQEERAGFAAHSFHQNPPPQLNRAEPPKHGLVASRHEQPAMIKRVS